MKPETDEKELLEGLARNDKKATETIYKDNYNTVQSLIINNNGSAEDAKDVFQEAMIVLYEKVRSGNFELSCLIKTYLYSVARRLWLKRLQQMNRYQPDLEGVGETVPVEEELENHARLDTEFAFMEKGLASLGEPCKSLIEAYYLQKRSMTEIAVAFGYTNADNAKTQKYKCLMRLKKIFFEQYKTTG
ncbi:MAG: sigma-70 family RNA polymerase sigma factor [Chitinophagaceae bacterium]